MVCMALILSIWAAGVLGLGCAGSTRQTGGASTQMARLPGEKPEPIAKPAPAVTQARGTDPAGEDRTAPGPFEDRKEETEPREDALDEAPPAPPGPRTSRAPAAIDPQAAVRPQAAPRTLSAGAADKGTTGAEGEEQKIVLNFDDADLHEVIRAIGDLLQISYLVDPGIQGKVTIHTAVGLRKKDLFPLFFQILEANGLTAVKEGPVYKIFLEKDASRMPLAGYPGILRKDAPPGERVIIEIIPLTYISAEEVTKLLTPFLSTGGMIVADQGSNTIVVVDNRPNISKVLELVKVFDVNIFERLNHRFYPLVNVNAVEASKVLNDVFAAHGKASLNYAKFIGIEKINTVLVLSANPHLFMKIDQLVRELDEVDNAMTRKIYVYFVKNGSAVDFGEILGKVLEKNTEGGTTSSSKKKEAGGTSQLSGNPFSKVRVEEKKAEKAAEAEGAPKSDKGASGAQPKQTAAKTTTIPQGEGGGADSLKSEVKITVDEIRNALIIEATPSDYQVILKLLKQLDRLPRQVLIEATIAEISREASMELGMNWALGAGAALGGASFAASVGGGGLKYSIGVSNKWYAELQALASKNKVNVLSSPHVLASDNKEARIDVSREIPVASSQTMYGTATAVTETAIQYRDTGVILIVTPHINDHGMVTMDIEEEVSDLEKNPILVAGKEYPAFFKRTITTTLTVKDGHTIAIGGLIKDKEDTLMSGVPCLIDIPVVRYLFGNYSENTEKNELIVLITPRVIDDVSDVDQVTHEFKSKVINVVDKYFR